MAGSLLADGSAASIEGGGMPVAQKQGAATIASPRPEDDTSSVKRRRLRGKQHTSLENVKPIQTQDRQGAQECTAITVQTSADKEYGLAARKQVYAQLKNMWVRQQFQSERAKRPESTPREVRDLLGRKFKATGKGVRKKLLDEVLSQYREGTVQHYVAQRMLEELPGQEVRQIEARSVLLTYQGPWGDLPLHEAPDVDLDTESVVRDLKARAEVVSLWSDLQEWVDRLATQVGASVTSCCLELCTDTLAKVREVKVHAHVFLASEKVKIRTRSGELLEFKGSAPNRSGMGLLPTKSRARINDAGDFYVQAPKIGQVFSRGSREPFRGFLVNSEWVTNLLQAKKITPQSARMLYLLCCRQAQRHLSNLALVEKENMQMKLEEVVSATQAAVYTLMKPRKKLPVVEDWIQSFRDLRPRYRFLVLTGPSCCGKSQFALQVEGVARTLDVTCGRGQNTHIDLRMHDPFRHSCILFDECPIQVILDNRRLFQAPCTRITLGASSTSVYSYQVWLHRCKLIVTSNTFQRELESLPPDDREWIETNAVIVKATGPLWDESGEPPCLSLPVRMDDDEDYFGPDPDDM